MDLTRIKAILQAVGRVRVAVYGDFCLDAYWLLDPAGSEISVETGIPAQAVGRHYYSPGGASNIVNNLAALKPAAIHAIGVVGDDVFGRELSRQLDRLGVNTDDVVVQEDSFQTYTFVKRYLGDVEQQRIDFGVRNARSARSEDHLLDAIRRALSTCDVVIFNQQVPGSCERPGFIERADALFEKFAERIVLLDSRHYGERFRHVWRKVNAVEAACLCGVPAEPGDTFPLEDLHTYGRRLFEQSGRPVFITRGDRGILTFDAAGVHEAPGIHLLPPLDPVGAGDTTLSALALSLAAGCEPAEAARFANLAAAVTVQKLFQTGTASADEILALADRADYVYQPELAEDISRARYLPGTRIEVCCPDAERPAGQIRHALFDHDGTISTLRQGWEQIMEPVMIRAILGGQHADAALREKVRRHVAEYIDRSTGEQTIVQMQALVEMVRRFGCVLAEQILDAPGYKRIYDAALMEMVNHRVDDLRGGRRLVSDFTIEGAVAFLEALRARGVRLYLASGTDEEDVRREAELLGYAGLFEGRIYGSVGDVKRYSKRRVIEAIIRENHLGGGELAVFGDGPVEMRQARRTGGLAVGIASDEVHRSGLNPEKRTRLIRAGAHLLLPDFADPDPLLGLMSPTFG